MKVVVWSTIVCNSLVWYDYALYGSLINIISKLYFPANSSYQSIMQTLIVFAIGFVMRPIGAVLFGYLGDRCGRKFSLLLSIGAMSIPVTLLCFLPTYHTIGIVAQILLILIRLFQGLALGGEASNAAFLVEHTPHKNRGLFGSLEVLSAVIGLIFANIAIALTKLVVSNDEFFSWGWRLPFLFGTIIGIIGTIIRFNTSESPLYEEHKESDSLSRTPLRDLLKNYRKQFFISIGIDIAEEASIYIFFVLFVSIAPRLLTGIGSIIHFVALIFLAICTVTLGALSDVIGRKRVMSIGCIGFIFLSPLMFWMLEQDNMILSAIAELIYVPLLAATLGPASAAMLESFPTKVRCSGFSISRNIAGAIAGGTAPMICTFLIEWGGDKIYASIYLVACALLSFICLQFFRDRYKQKIN